MHVVTKAALGTVGAGLGVLGWASLVERNAFRLRRVSVPVLPPGSPPVRVLHISDLHLLPRQRWRAKWVKELASLDPDLVVDTGDNLASYDAVPAVLDAFEWLLDRRGVFVLGSNDYFGPSLKNPLRYLWHRGPAPERAPSTRLPVESLVSGLTDRGWVELTNRRASLQAQGMRIDFVGVDDPHLRYDRLDLVRGPASPEATLTIGVTHAPYQRVLDTFVADGAGLVIAGHTHGGQVCVPWYGALVTNCDIDPGRVKGLSRWWVGAGHGHGAPVAPSSAAPDDAAWLHVSAGLGTSPAAPVRLACRPEATLLTLVARQPSGEADSELVGRLR
ncbi:MAG: metallophosphoesterase [Intrasporangium sp.]|uniref:metallophosphoesterase n=1 Tax=Intrasporangium sp. TaxID=1925024 RepID=UPI002648B801|nr:metallophosphoesterase [Intrasporangium sp.]MDN5797768.1 metallophosphoesterase [Intrasporangium sp.]